jgi:hypothetical protein
MHLGAPSVVARQPRPAEVEAARIASRARALGRITDMCSCSVRRVGTTWVVLIALGTVAAVTGWIPAEGAGAIFGFLALTVAIQNVVVARRTLWPQRTSIGATA